MKDYKKIFHKVESTLISVGSSNIPAETIYANLNEFKQLEEKAFSDADYYWGLVCVVFYAGFRAATITAKLNLIRQYFPDYENVAGYDESKVDEILNDPEMIRNRRKIRSCIENAKVFKAIVREHGSIKAYIDSFSPKTSFENLMLLKEELEYRFKGLGRITTYHFLTDIGMPVLKPDRVICRIFKRLGLIESDQQLLKTVIQGRKFAQATGHPIRYIDIVFVAYGQVESQELGLSSGICLEKKPLCSICGVKDYCNYFKRNFIHSNTLPGAHDFLFQKRQLGEKDSKIADSIQTNHSSPVRSTKAGNTRIGPFRKSEIVLCSADASPGSQRQMPCEAEYFFSGGKWVRALGNAANRLNCRFVILTTGHGMVNPHDLITPFDLHINGNEGIVTEKWQKTIPAILRSGKYRLLVFYSGGCPRERYIEIMKPILHDLGIELLSFGRPSMYDINMVDNIIELLTQGTTLEGLRAVLGLPDRLVYYPVCKTKR